MKSLRRLALVAAIVLAAALSASAAATAQPLRTTVLTPAQVGSGYRMSVIPQGTQVAGQVTLDLCGFSFPSESLRVARLQVSYTRTGSTLRVSNEVVRYRPGGAQRALREVAHAASHCPRGSVGSTVAGVGPITYRIGKIADSKLLAGAVALRVHFSGTIRGHKAVGTALVVYQARGNVLSGVYTNALGAFAEQLRVGLHAAEESAANLHRLA